MPYSHHPTDYIVSDEIETGNAYRRNDRIATLNSWHSRMYDGRQSRSSHLFPNSHRRNITSHIIQPSPHRYSQHVQLAAGHKPGSTDKYSTLTNTPPSLTSSFLGIGVRLTSNVSPG